MKEDNNIYGTDDIVEEVLRVFNEDNRSTKSSNPNILRRRISNHLIFSKRKTIKDVVKEVVVNDVVATKIANDSIAIEKDIREFLAKEVSKTLAVAIANTAVAEESGLQMDDFSMEFVESVTTLLRYNATIEVAKKLGVSEDLLKQYLHSLYTHNH